MAFASEQSIKGGERVTAIATLDMMEIITSGLEVKALSQQQQQQRFLGLGNHRCI